jgi:ATP-dependent Lhr-like helicase
VPRPPQKSSPKRSTKPLNADPLDAFRPATADWFRAAFSEPTAPQRQGWPAIAGGHHALVAAPTGTGKTLAAFLWCLDRLMAEPPPAEPMRRLRVLYISPLKALVHDIERNLRAPLTGIALAAQRRGEGASEVRVAMRTGDTPAQERRAFGRRPPDILVTTPESLYLILTSAAREALRSVEWVIVDEIHALAGTKRGAHLALSLERLEAIADRSPQRIGLSATVRPLDAVAAFLGGHEVPPSGVLPAGGTALRPVTIVDTGIRKPLDLQVVVPVEDMAHPGEDAAVIPDSAAKNGGVGVSVPKVPAAHARATPTTSIWPAIDPRILELIRAHHSTIVFANSRRIAERLAQRLNDLAGEELVLAHHGSLAREQRLVVEERLKSGHLAAIVATSSLELGIDMGTVDLVIQVESPRSVARGLQRIGRAGHHVDTPSKGVIFPKYRGDLLECALVTRRMRDGLIEETVVPRNPLDVLAQQIVATAADRPWPVEELYRLARRADNYAELGQDTFEAVLGMLAGQYPSDEFAELMPRIVWDRVAGTVRSRRDATTVALVSGGTIPDRGLYGVFLEDGTGAPGADVTRAADRRRGGRRVGELDEEMVYESRAGEVILLGASAWRIEQITHDRVLVTPAPGEPGRVPFWHGDLAARPVELGRALGEFTRSLSDEASSGKEGPRRAARRLVRDHDLDELAARNLLAYLADELDAAGALPTDRTIVLQRFRDELGDWRFCLLSPLGGRIHAPWALAIEARLRESLGVEVQPIWSDDGIVIRLPATEDAVGEPALAAVEAAILLEPDEVEDLVVAALGGSALFAARFRENAARALLLPRRRPGTRTPLWQMRQRAAQLLSVVSDHGSFPILLETYRECLRDVFDLPALREVLGAIQRREIGLHRVETAHASPFAGSLMLAYVAEYMYEGDAPLVDRRAQALALDRDLLRELLGAEELRELLDRDALAELELELQALTDERAARSADAVHDLLRRLGDLTAAEVAARVRGADERSRTAAAGEWLEALAADRRAVAVRIAGEERWIAAEDAARYRDAVGVAMPTGLAGSLIAPSRDSLGTLLARWARHHGPFLAREPAARWGLPAGIVEERLERALADGTLVRGEFRPDGVEREWCDPEVLRLLRRRSLARLRREVEPVDAAAYARFLPAWQGIGSSRGGVERLAEVIGQLEGLPLPASILERDVLPARVRGYVPRLLDELGAAGEVSWIGHGSLGRDDGRIALYRPDRLALLVPMPDGPAPEGPSPEELMQPPDPSGREWIRVALIDHLSRRGASFYRDLLGTVLSTARDRGRRAPAQRDVLDALWDLVWAGRLTNDTFAPLRALAWPRRGGESGPRSGARLGPPEAAGRWSLVADAIATARALGGEPSDTERRLALALRLLDRHGVLTRDGVAAEEVPGGFGAVYPVLRELEDQGRVRRGYFVEGLGGAQFALAGGVERLRALRTDPGGDGEPRSGRSARGQAEAGVLVLAAADPANPYGAALPWPRRGDADGRAFPRAAGAFVVLRDGEPVVYLERGGRTLQTLPAFDAPGAGEEAVAALLGLAERGRLRSLRIERIDGEPVAASPLAARLAAAGFRPSYRGYSAPRPAAFSRSGTD